MISSYQNKILSDFFRTLDAFYSLHENPIDATPTGDVDFDEFAEELRKATIYFIVPVGKTKQEYFNDLEEALILFFKIYPEDYNVLNGPTMAIIKLLREQN